MELGLKEFEQFIKTKELEISDGVFLVCKEEVRLVIYAKDDTVIVEFEAPFAYLLVKKIGPKRLLNVLEPKVKQICIKESSIVIQLSNFPDFEIER